MQTVNKQKSNIKKLIALNKARATHNRANSRVKGYADRTYGIWQAMRGRCTNNKRADYKYYGGRGISYDSRWDNFLNFVADMGEAPKDLTLDRIDNNVGYSKENCRWVSRKDQVYNSSRIRLITIAGETKPLRDWLLQTGVSRGSFYYQLGKGKSEAVAIFGEDL